MVTRKIRVLLAKPGLDGHDRGVKVVARALRDAGMEVIYLGTFQTPESIVRTAIEEGADAIVTSWHNLSHVGWCREIMEELKKRGGGDICVFAGGIIHEYDWPTMEEIGVTGYQFGPGTAVKEITDHIWERVRKERWSKR